MVNTTQEKNDIFQYTGKYNTSVRLTEEDKKNHVKIYCHEPYAQEMYDALVAHEKKSQGGAQAFTKDLKVEGVYTVIPKTISFKDKSIYCEEVNSNGTVIVPFREYSRSLDELQAGEHSKFLVTIYKTTQHGEYYGSEKKAVSISYRQELFDHLQNNTWFSVKITKLIKGGYLAKYNNEIECFIPGSQVAANIVHNFNDMLGKELPIMVDNYDTANSLFILSYKKYITHSMPTKISELHFNQEYTGTLTNKPYDFGVFVEFDNYFTGLIHKSEFDNYDQVRSTLKTGDELKVYVKDVTSKAGQYRVVLTLDADKVNPDRLAWEKLRAETENQSFPYRINDSKNSIEIDINGEPYEVSLKRKDLEANLSEFPFVRVSKVDPIHKNLKFEFVSSK